MTKHPYPPSYYFSLATPSPPQPYLPRLPSRGSTHPLIHITPYLIPPLSFPILH